MKHIPSLTNDECKRGILAAAAEAIRRELGQERGDMLLREMHSEMSSRQRMQEAVVTQLRKISESCPDPISLIPKC